MHVDERRSIERFHTTWFGWLAYAGVTMCIGLLVLIGARKL